MYDKIFTPEAWQQAWEVVQSEFLFGLWETFYVTVVATFFAVVLGLPLGILLVAGDKGGVLPLPKAVLGTLNIVINLLRSVPFLILMIASSF